jgi:replicative DNA helicase
MPEETTHPETIAAEAMPRSELERRCLSALEKDKNAVLQAISIGLAPGTFKSPPCRHLFSLMAAAVTAGVSTEPGQEVCLQILKLGAAAPMGQTDWFAVQALEQTSINARRHVEQVIAYAKWDALLAILKKTYHSVKAHTVPDWPTVMEEAAGNLSKVNDLAADSTATALPDIIDQYITDQLDPFHAKVTPTGIAGWDRPAGSLREGELVTLASRPGVGKTALAVQISTNVIARNEVVAFFSLEMTGKSLVGRLALQRAGRDGVGDHIRERDRRVEAARALKAADKNLYLYQERESRTVAAIEARCRLLAASKRGLNLIVIDYLQLIQPPPELRKANREEKVAETTRRLKMLANDLKCPIIVLAQLNRESEKAETPRAPRLSDLRESGAIEQDSDRVWFLYTPIPAAGDVPIAPNSALLPVMLLQAKCREGTPGIAHKLQFNRPIFTFTSLTATDPEPAF